ncbi:PKD domain-containing protein [Hymenobacter sp. B81]|uniref:PKD domain-containing protein n=1 Tax=Hymenobacter sp. B81 TaxID=3344878 RepID=UPI0037DC017A
MHFFSTHTFRRRPLAGLLLFGTLALASCEVEEGRLEGPAPTADFAVQLNTAQYPVVATFTNNSQNATMSQWNFGDGSPIVTGGSVTHTYLSPGDYEVKLQVAGRGGSGYQPVRVSIPTICSNTGFSALTDCGGSGNGGWTFSRQAGAIKRFSAGGALLSSSTPPLPDCQSDDVFTFSKTFGFSYDAGGETYRNGACAAASNPAASSFVFRPSGSLGQIVLQGRGAFIGLADSVKDKTYDIVEASAAQLRLRGIHPDGSVTEVTLTPPPSALERAKLRLTGGASRTWVLDNTQAAAIVVGTEGNPTEYYAGGPAGSLPPCQADDEFTFSMSDVYSYNALAQTLVAGGGGCSAPRSGTTPFTFGPVAGSVEGMAQFTLATAGSFIGITDAPDLVYRILSITNQTMVLRAGDGSGVVFTMKLRVK